MLTLSHTIPSPAHPALPASALAHSSSSPGLTLPPPTSSTPAARAANLNVKTKEGGTEEIVLYPAHTETPKSLEDGKDKLKDGLRINTTSITSPIDKRRPGPLDLTGTRSASPVVGALATACVIADIATVPYPEVYKFEFRYYSRTCPNPYLS
jgi:hypothetical protein